MRLNNFVLWDSVDPFTPVYLRNPRLSSFLSFLSISLTISLSTITFPLLKLQPLSLFAIMLPHFSPNLERSHLVECLTHFKRMETLFSVLIFHKELRACDNLSCNKLLHSGGPEIRHSIFGDRSPLFVCFPEEENP